MLTKRIIPCLDIKEGKVVKGIRFKEHQYIGEVLDYARYYQEQGADELVCYDITASSDGRTTNNSWVREVARLLDIPFCVAGGIRTLDDATLILNSGADKISINSPALENPNFISLLAETFGTQCVVVGIDSYQVGNDYYVYQYTGDPTKSRSTMRRTADWVKEVEERGAGEVVINCMNQDGVRKGYDVKQLSLLRELVNIPLIASGGAGAVEDFRDVFVEANVDGALAASVFHQKSIRIPALKQFLLSQQIEVRS